jgi:putative DNA primase/helicase
MTKADRADAGEASGGAGSPVLLADREPWPAPVDDEQMLRDTAAFIERHVMLPPGAAVACALWVIHTFVYERFTHSPRLAITSPAPRCGKTTLLELLTWLVQRPLSAANITSAVVFRAIEQFRPSLMVDEADTFLAEDEALRGILNAGHRKGGQVLRLVGDQHEPRAFNVYAPAGIAMIGNLPETLKDRSITVEMRRKTASEARSRITRATEREATELASKAARWAADNAAALDPDAEPSMPSSLHDRAADNWRPLFIIARAIGPNAVKSVTDACIALSGAVPNDDDDPNRLPQMLLEDMQEIFNGAGASKITTDGLLAGLTLMEGRPWRAFDHGRQITAWGLAKLLSGFGIRPKTIKLPDGKTAKGYQRADCADAWTRYLPAVPDDIDTLMGRETEGADGTAPGGPF